MKTVQDIFDEMTGIQKNIAYELIGQALEEGCYDHDWLIVFNTEQQKVILFLINKALKL